MQALPAAAADALQHQRQHLSWLLPGAIPDSQRSAWASVLPSPAAPTQLTLWTQEPFSQRVAAFQQAFWKFLRPHTIRGTILGSVSVTARTLIECREARSASCTHQAACSRHGAAWPADSLLTLQLCTACACEQQAHILSQIGRCIADMRVTGAQQLMDWDLPMHML